MIFADAWARFSVGDAIIVSDGLAEPAQDTVAWRGWRSHNFTGTVEEKIDGPPRVLRVGLDHDFGHVSYDIVEDATHDFTPAEPSLPEIRTTKKTQLSEVRDTVVLATVETSNYGTFYADDKTKILMLGEVLGILLAQDLGVTPPATVDFKRVDGWHTFDLVDFKMAAMEVLGGIKGIFALQKTLEATIDSLDDPAAIEAVSWDV